MNEEKDLKEIEKLYEETKESGKRALRECNAKIIAGVIIILMTGFALLCSTMLLLGYSAMIFYIVPFAVSAFFTVSSICATIKHIKTKNMIKRMQLATDILTGMLINKRDVADD